MRWEAIHGIDNLVFVCLKVGTILFVLSKSLINNPEQLNRLIEAIHPHTVVALDTEADSLHAYPAKVCLIQIGLPGSDDLVDPLCKLDLNPLWKVLADKELLLHGSDYDLKMLCHCYQFRPARLFDTMLAARLSGMRQFGLGDLVRTIVGVELDKGPQKADWGQRPLTPRMEEYARNDTKYLFQLREHFVQLLTSKGRLAWLEEWCAQMIVDYSQPFDSDPDSVWRVKGSNKLPRRGLAIIRELWAWREKEATAANRPPYFILSHDTMNAMALAAINDEPWEGMLSPKMHPRRREGVRIAMKKGMSVPAAEWPDKPRHKFISATEEQKQKTAQFQEKRDKVAAELELDPTLIASRATLEALARDPEKTLPEMMKWQRELLGV